MGVTLEMSPHLTHILADDERHDHVNVAAHKLIYSQARETRKMPRTPPRKIVLMLSNALRTALRERTTDHDPSPRLPNTKQHYLTAIHFH